MLTFMCLGQDNQNGGAGARPESLCHESKKIMQSEFIAFPVMTLNFKM